MSATSAPHPPLTGIPLADALFAAGLAPRGVFWQAVLGYSYTRSRLAWQPWCDIAAVWHLVLCYRMDILLRRYPGESSSVSVAFHHEEALDDADLPAAIGRLALRLHAAETTGLFCAACDYRLGPWGEDGACPEHPGRPTYVIRPGGTP